MLNKPLTTGEIARFCHVTDRAVLKWVEDNKIKAYRTPGNHSRISVEDFLSFLREYNMPIPTEFQSKREFKRILIVDDDRELVGAIKRVLNAQHKYEIDAAFDGFMAGQKFAEFKPDLILLDIRMPGMDGYDVCARLRKDPASKNVKIIILSGALDMDGVEKIMQLGANDYLTKPFRNDFLLMMLDRVLIA